MKKYDLSVEEYYDLAAIGLCKAAIGYDADRCEYFSVYAYDCMFSAVFVELRKEKAKRKIPNNHILYYEAELDDSNGGDTSTFINYIPSKENVEESVLSEIIFNEYLSKLKDRDKQIFILFREGYKQIEISKKVGCLRCIVVVWLRKSCRRWSQYTNKVVLYSVAL